MPPGLLTVAPSVTFKFKSSVNVFIRYYQKLNLKLCWLSILPKIKRPLTKKKIKLLFNSFQLHWNVLRAYLLID